MVITGARQVGKSTLLQNTLGKQAEIVVFDPVIDIENARHDPELFLNNHPPPLILDEIQYEPEPIASIKRRIDKNHTPGQYVLTGSLQWGVIRSMAESLAGRSLFLDLHSFSLLEIDPHYTITPWAARWLKSPDDFLAHSQSRHTFTNDSEYIRDLIRRDQAYKADPEAIRAALIEAEQSGKPQPFDGDLFKKEMIAKHGKRKGSSTHY